MAKISWIVMKVLLAWIAIWCCTSPCLALDCYTCDGDIGTPEGDRCANGTNTTSAGNFDYCYTRDEATRVERNGDNRSGTTSQTLPYCESSSCYCNTNLCNSQKFEKPTTVSCYVCNSLPFFDNGCGNGDYWKPNAGYMRKESGCTACSKTQNANSISRGCLQSMHATDRCSVGLTSITCVCTADDCNHASSLLPAYTAMIIGFIFKRLI